MKYFAKNLRFIRKNWGLTQKKIGEFLSVKSNTISSYESSTIEPSIRILEKIESVFEIPIETLLNKDLQSASKFSKEKIDRIGEKFDLTSVAVFNVDLSDLNRILANLENATHNIIFHLKHDGKDLKKIINLDGEDSEYEIFKLKKLKIESDDLTTDKEVQLKRLEYYSKLLLELSAA